MGLNIKGIQTAFFVVLFIFLGFLVYTKLNGPIPFSVTSVTTTKNNQFSVQGTGQVNIVPDTADITLEVTKTETSAVTAQSEVNTIIQKITADIIKIGVPKNKITTTNYSINPNYDDNNNITNYTADATIELLIQPVKLASKSIDIATQDGVTDVNSMQFTIDAATRTRLEDQARIAAINNAKGKAQTISQAAGISLGKVVNITDDSNYFPQPQPILPMMAVVGKAAAQAASATQLNPGQSTISDMVTLTYEIN